MTAPPTDLELRSFALRSVKPLDDAGRRNGVDSVAADLRALHRKTTREGRSDFALVCLQSLGSLLRREGRFEECIAVRKRAVRLAESLETLVALGEAQVDAKKWRAALTTAKRAFEKAATHDQRVTALRFEGLVRRKHAEWNATPEAKGPRPSEIYYRALTLCRASLSRRTLREAHALLEQARAAGDPWAEYALGTWYLFGRFVPRSTNEGVKLVARAARAGVPAAQFDYGVSFDYGRGVARNVRSAYRWYAKAAANGDVEGMVAAADCLFFGDGVRRNPSQATALYRKAARRGSAKAAAALTRIRSE